MQTVYGTISKADGTHHDTSKTLRGAKIYATKNGYDKVTKRQGYNAFIVSVKTSKGWVDYGSKEHEEWKRKQKSPDYFERMEQIKKEKEMDNKPFEDINPSY